LKKTFTPAGKAYVSAVGTVSMPARDRDLFFRTRCKILFDEHSLRNFLFTDNQHP
jgi:hypothetical protein